MLDDAMTMWNRVVVGKEQPKAVETNKVDQSKIHKDGDDDDANRL